MALEDQITEWKNKINLILKEMSSALRENRDISDDEQIKKLQLAKTKFDEGEKLLEDEK